MLKRLKKLSEKLIVKDEDYRFVLDEICDHNRRLVLVLCSIFVAIFSILVVLGFLGLGVSRADIPVFLFALLYAAMVLLLVGLSPKDSHRLTMLAMYLVIAAALSYGLAVSYRSPEQYTATFIAIMGIISMTFVDKPIRMATVNAFFTVICAGMVLVHKDVSVRAGDLINLISFFILSSVGGTYTMNMKIHSYVMDKMQSRDIARGQQQLSAKEAEAAQLLTAVMASYAMVVSVNLSKNTYRLMGDETFVTKGDSTEGNFDDVINAHAALVVDEHRQKYYDTFSRHGLLNAYSEGAKDVYLEYQQRDENGVPHWLGTHTMFTSGPSSTDITEITISQNIDDRMQREAETKAILQAERDRAEQAQKAKTDFLFQMSHDIRTPMNAIIGFTNFIKSSSDLETIHGDYIPKLENASQQLLMLINDALEMSRIESGKLVFRRETQDVRAIIKNVMAVMQIQAEEKDVTLTEDIDVDNPVVCCDQNHLNRVILNLLSNAVKFTPPGGRVTVSLREKPTAPAGRTSFVLKVADTGIGMSPEFMEKVFEPFEREQTSTISGMQGTGLGLAIVKRIVEANGDKISVKSHQGQGSVFTLELTLLRGDPAALPKHQGQERRALSLEQMAEYFRGKRILLVEDNEFNLTIAQVLLENAGFHVETATDGLVAVNKVAGAPVPDYYDAILMDIQMPVMDGYEAARAIRAMADDRSKTRIIAVTANAFDTDRDNALAAGMNGHIAKPIDVAILYSMLWSILPA